MDEELKQMGELSAQLTQKIADLRRHIALKEMSAELKVAEHDAETWGRVATFLVKVRELREQQKLYFTTRSKDALRKSIDLEKEVDGALKSDILILEIIANF